MRSCFDIAMVLFMSLLNPFTWPCAFGWQGVMRWCLKPDSFANFSKVSELNGGPLSVWSVWGMPCVEKIFFSFFLVPSKDVVVVNSISGYLEYWSVTTRAYFPFGNAPHKSISTAVQGLAGSSVIFAGCVCLAFVEIWHSKHLLTDSLICKFMLGHQCLCRIISLVFDSPRCPCLCAICMILVLRFSGWMILSSRKIMFSNSYNSACASMYGFRTRLALF